MRLDKDTGVSGSRIIKELMEINLPFDLYGIWLWWLEDIIRYSEIFKFRDVWPPQDTSL